MKGARDTRDDEDDGDDAADADNDDDDGHDGSRLVLPRSTERRVTIKASLIIRGEAYPVLRLNDPVEAVRPTRELEDTMR